MSGESILIVDDNAANLRLLSFLLVGAGYDIRTATDAEQALAILETFHPRMLLLDLRLPGIDGLTLTRQLRADPATRGLIIVAVTAQAMRGDREAALAAGCDGFITKPIDTRSLPTTIAEHLTRTG
jgi:CheY-like chemotaxis protein